MQFPDVNAPHWAGLLDACGVLGVLGLWLMLDSARSRAVASVCGGALLVLITGQALVRGAGIAFATGLPRFFDVGPHRWGQVALALGAFVVAVVVASWHPHPVEAVPEEPAADPYAEIGPVPASAWSRPEVIGEAPHGVPDEPVEDDVEDDEPDDEQEPGRVREVAVPVLAVAVGVSLPGLALNTASSLDLYDRFFRGDLGPWGGATHVLAGVVVGIALLGAVLAFGVRDVRLGGVAFAVAAVGVGLQGAWPRLYFNEWWAVFAAGLTAGLLVTAGLAALRRAPAVDRRTVLAGVGGALVVISAFNVANARAYDERRQTGFNQGF